MECAPKLSCICDLCGNTRILPGSEVAFDWSNHPDAILSGKALECSWCRAVRMKYGSYYYPIEGDKDG